MGSGLSPLSTLAATSVEVLSRGRGRGAPACPPQLRHDRLAHHPAAAARRAGPLSLSCGATAWPTIPRLRCDRPARHPTNRCPLLPWAIHHFTVRRRERQIDCFRSTQSPSKKDSPAVRTDICIPFGREPKPSQESCGFASKNRRSRETSAFTYIYQPLTRASSPCQENPARFAGECGSPATLTTSYEPQNVRLSVPSLGNPAEPSATHGAPACATLVGCLCEGHVFLDGAKWLWQSALPRRSC